MRIVILSTLATVALISAATCGAETGPASPADSSEPRAHGPGAAEARRVTRITTDSRQVAEPPSELTQDFLDHDDRRARHASRD